MRMRSITHSLIALISTSWTLHGQEPRAGGPSPDAAGLVRADTEFAVDLYRQLAARPGNLFLSPYSISTALAMTYAGARGQTAEAMSRTLHFTLPPERLNQAFAELNQQLLSPGRKRPLELHGANALFAAQNFAFRPEYQQGVQAAYGAALERLDFMADPEGARKHINRWVEQQTKDKIKDLVAPGIISPQTRLVLTNAIYFKAPWLSTFPEALTQDENFTLAGGSKVKAKLMRQVHSFAYLEGEGFQYAELPYQGGDVSLVVLLPRQADGLAALERAVTADNLRQWQAKAASRRVDLYLPKFKVTAEFSLKDALTALGMGMAFGDSADFSGMTSSAGLAISAVLHKAFIDVNEKGTEAAAATAVGVKLTSVAPTPQPPVVFRADRPFLMMLRDNPSGSVLFLGRVVDPR
jgi:serpin B